MGNSAHLSAHKLLRNARPYELHRRCMHPITYLGGAFQFLHFLVFFHRAHLDDRADEWHRGRIFLLIGVNPQQVEQLQLDVMPIRWQEMQLTFLPHSLMAERL